MAEVSPITKEDQCYPVRTLCPCGCGTEGAPRRKVMKDGLAHVRNCPCRRCAGSRSRKSGQDKQRRARAALGVPASRYGSQTAHEESWRDPWFVDEVKSGRFDTDPIARRFLRFEDQIEAARPIGDTRLTRITVMPEGWGGEGIVMVRLSTWRSIIHPRLQP